MNSMSVDLKTLYQKRTNGVEGVRWNLTSPLLKKQQHTTQSIHPLFVWPLHSDLSFDEFFNLDIRETVTFYKTNNVGFI